MSHRCPHLPGPAPRDSRNGADLDPAVVRGFGAEWSRFDQRELAGSEYEELFESYFSGFPWSALPPRARGFDLGCGSGRWARGVAPRVGMLYCLDPSRDALAVARRNLAALGNVRLIEAAAGAVPLGDATMDFGYCLGVLHHTPDMERGLREAVRTLKRGAPFLLYLYYRFDNRPAWYRALWRLSDALRKGISRLPFAARSVACDAIAGGIYWPLARGARVAERLGLDLRHWPLTAYRRRSFYVMRTDALDRFGTHLERRVTRAEMAALMERCGLIDVRFGDRVPFWTAVGCRAGDPEGMDSAAGGAEPAQALP